VFVSSFFKEETTNFSSPAFSSSTSPVSPPFSFSSARGTTSGFFALVILFTLTVHSWKSLTLRVNLESPFFKFNCHGFVLSNLSKRSCTLKGQLDQKSCGTDTFLFPPPVPNVEEIVVFVVALMRSSLSRLFRRSKHLSKNCSTVSFTNTVAFWTTRVALRV
jgi:hypothetical protein